MVVLRRARNYFGGRRGVVIRWDAERDCDALIATDGVIAMVLRSAAVMRNDELVFFKEHVADCDRFVEKTAWIATHVENEAVEIRGVKFLQGLGNFVVGCFVERGQAEIADGR